MQGDRGKEGVGCASKGIRRVHYVREERRSSGKKRLAET